MRSDLHPEQYDREELELLQQRAQRSWLDSTWLAEHRPRDWRLVENFPEGEVWLQLGGGRGESQQQAGAIVLGHTRDETDGFPTFRELSASGERREPDLYWRGPKVPASASSVDRVFVTNHAIEEYDAVESVRLLLKEVQRVLRPACVVEFERDLRKEYGPLLKRLGFEDEAGGGRLWRLVTKTLRDVDRDPPMYRETVLGESGPRFLRSV
jgi:hypothetical protein